MGEIKNLSDQKLYQLCQTYGQNARIWSRKFAALLQEVESRKLYKKYNFYCIYDFAAKIGGLGRKTVDEILRTYRKVENKPLLRAEIETQGYGKVRAALPLIEDVQESPYVPMNFKIHKNIEFKLRKYQQDLEKERKEKVEKQEQKPVASSRPCGKNQKVPSKKSQRSGSTLPHSSPHRSRGAYQKRIQ